MPHKHKRVDLRHGTATLLFRMGVHPKIVQEQLGHHDIGTTMNIYSHMLPTMQEGVMKQLNSLFQQRPNLSVSFVQPEAES